MSGDDPIKIVNYAFAGLSMMLNIRLVYSASPYALMRFKLPENLFSVFVRVMASSLELWCLPSMIIGNIIDLIDKYISDPHERRRFNDAPKYDVKDDGSLGSRLKKKAEVLQTAAKALENKANADVGLSKLKEPAQQLASAAGELASGSAASDKATNVIDKFDKLETEYDGHGEKAKVEKEFNTVKHIYDRILNVKKAKKLQGQAATMLSNASDLHTKAETLAGAEKVSNDVLRELATDLAKAVGDVGQGLRGALKALDSARDTDDQEKAELVEKALNVINAYNAVAAAYQAVTAQNTAYTSALKGGDESKYNDVESKFKALQKEYNKGKCKVIVPIYDKEQIRYQSIFWMWLNFATFVLLLIVFVTGGDEGNVTGFYWVIAASGFVFGINMVFVYAMEYEYFPWYIAGENSFPIITSFMHYVSTLVFGNRRKWNSDYIVVLVDMVMSLAISFISASLWTYCYVEPSTHEYFGPSSINPAIVSPVLMVLVGMGLVFTIYPGIAPGMIVPFYLIDKIEMVLLILTTFPPLLFATLRKLYSFGHPAQPMCGWSNPSAPWLQGQDGRFWHTFDILIPLQISLAIIFIYSLHYRDSSISHAIVNQPKMSTFLSIIFYMCHEIMLALGFPGIIGNNGGDQIMLPIQLIGAFLMVLLAFYSIGYITEYKRHDPSQWPTEGMTKWNALCYWLKMASKITNKNFKQLFTTDLRRDLSFIINKI